MSQTLLGQSNSSREAPIYYSRPPDRKNYYGFENLPDLAMRDGKWKLLCDYDGGRPELYDLIIDPGEIKNLAQANSETVQAMVNQVISWWNSMPKLNSMQTYISGI